MGPAVGAAARALGLPLMPWQQLVADIGLEIDPDTGTLAYREVVYGTPRQSGKTQLLLAWELQRALGWGSAQRIVYSAQTGNDGRKKLIEDQIPLLEPRRVALGIRRILKGMGNEAIEWRNGSRLVLMASAVESGHGKTVDLGVVDEAFSDVDARREQALIPAMITRPAAQIVFTSTAGTEDSMLWNRKVATGRAAVEAGRTSGIAYFEWSAEAGVDLDDPDEWWRFMPALGATQSVGAIQHARLSMPVGEFERAFGNRMTGVEELVIPQSVWDAACSSRAPTGALMYAVDVNPQRTMASIGVAGVAAGVPVVELIEHRAGTAWVGGRLVELVGRYGGRVALESTGPVGSLIPELEAARVQVAKLSKRDVASACGAFYDDVIGGLVEIRRHRGLDAAIRGAVKSTSGDSWVWGRRSSTADVSPLVAVTVALWAAKTSTTPQFGVKNLADYLDDDWEDDE